MDTEQRLNHVANKYRAQGYEVIAKPVREDLPEFAKDFKVEILAKRDDGCVLVSVKRSQRDLETDRQLPGFAEIIEKQPGWRFDVIVLESEAEPQPNGKEAHEPSEEDVRRAFEDVERMLQTGFVRQALIAAWAVLETAMRRRVEAEGEEAGWGTSPRTMLNELYSGGVLESSVFRDLEGLYQLRSALVHGFTPTPVIEPSAVRFLLEKARVLLEESRVVKKTA